MRRTTTAVLGLAAMAFLIVAPAGAAADYLFETLQVPGPSSTQTNAFGLNEDGVVVGTYRDGSTTRGFRYENGTYATINVGASSTFLRAINNAGQMTGAARISASQRDGFVRNPDASVESFQLFSPPGFTLPYGINDAGVVVGGKAATPAGNQSAFIRQGGAVTEFAVPDATNTYAYAINNAGVVAGTFNPAGGGAASFIRSAGGEISVLEVDGLDEPTVFGINDHGLVVGGANEVDGFISDGLTAWIVNFPGASRTTLTDINNRGDLVGIYESDGVTRSFIARVPEPASLVLLSLAGLARRRR